MSIDNQNLYYAML